MSDTKRVQPRPGFAGPGLKAIIVTVLVLAFLLPLALVKGIVEDRRSTRDKAEASIVGPAGGSPRLFGPFLRVPYERRKGRETLEGEIVVLPETLAISSNLRAEKRKRGIFSATILEAEISIEGTLTAQASEAAPSGAVVRWDLARVGFELPDLRSLSGNPELSWDGRALALGPEPRSGKVFDKSVSARVRMAAGASAPFAASIKLRSGDSLSFLEPAGTVLAVVSGAWPSPSFFGYSSPAERSVGDGAFRARWYLPESSQGLPRAFDAGSVDRGKLAEAAFGVRLLDGVDAYDMAWRATRYGLLFVIVPFAVLFLFELTTRSRIHPVQYALVGLGNCLFYLLLLSLSEVAGFGPAYLIAAGICAALCGSYAAAALRSSRGLWLIPALALLYAYLYAVLSSEDYALLLGSLGLLGLLAAAMAATRKVDWYGSGGEGGRASPAGSPGKPGREPEGSDKVAGLGGSSGGDAGEVLP